MVKINIIGEIFGTSGYQNHTRQLTNALFDNGAEISLLANRVPGWEVMVNDKEMKMLNTEPFRNENTIFIGLPNFWKTVLNEFGGNFYGYLVWEGDRIPKSFLYDILEIQNEIKGIMVPSEHVRTAILNTDDLNELGIPIYVIPHGVNMEIFKPIETKHDKFTFMCNKGWNKGINDRGGIQWAIKAFAEEFKKEENVRLLIKLNPAYIPPNFNLIDEFMKIGINNNYAEIAINGDNMDQIMLNKMYNDCDVFLSPSMADGFNIPCVEAMSCGKPCITTSFGGQSDYVNAENGFLIDGELIEVDWDLVHEGNHWCKPNIEQLKETMRYCFENQDTIKQMGLIAKKDIEKFTWNESAKKIIEVLS
jgi:glycosyltransferase involved in cell wall biosynthesis